MDKDERNIIETASATTSPDNANSGNFAYVIVAITCAGVLVLSLITSGIASFALAILAREPEASQGFGTTNPEDLQDYDQMQELWEEYYDDLFSEIEKDEEEDKTKDRDEEASGDVTVEGALDFDLAAYAGGLESQVPASAYANVPTEVHDIVRSIISVDTDYSRQVARTLDSAARIKDDAERAAKVSEAHAACDEAKAALDALEIAQLTDVEDASVRDLLGSAKGEAARRFELMADEIAVLEEGDPVDTERLWKCDGQVGEALEKASDLIIEAMETARTH